MMLHRVRIPLLTLLLAGIAACDHGSVAAPIPPDAVPPPTAQPPGPNPLPPTPAQPPVPALPDRYGDVMAIYGRVTPSAYTGYDYFVFLSEESFFFLSSTGHLWHGAYTRSGDTFIFAFADFSSFLPGVAEGTLSGEVLFVRYNFTMDMSGFEDGAYVKVK